MERFGLMPKVQSISMNEKKDYLVVRRCLWGSVVWQGLALSALNTRLLKRNVASIDMQASPE